MAHNIPIVDLAHLWKVEQVEVKEAVAKEVPGRGQRGGTLPQLWVLRVACRTEHLH